MEFALTTMSANGQVVIPAEIRRDAGFAPSEKFLVFNEGPNVLLKRIDRDKLGEFLDFVEMIEESERQIREGKVIKADTKMSVEEIDDLLMKG